MGAKAIAAALTASVVLLAFFARTASSRHLRTGRPGCSGTSDPDCLKCGPRGCSKCPGPMIYPGRKCVEDCPFGYSRRWSTTADVMGQICVRTGSPFGVSNRALTVLAGVACGAFVCFFVIGSAVAYVRYKRHRASEHSSEVGSDLDDSPERKEFLKQLEGLRPYSKAYLEMLNDTRRQLRENHAKGDPSAAAAYRPVLRDLAKILLLLNRPVERIAIPEDWDHLANWAEKALRRYKRMADDSQPPVAQLINFLQEATPPPSDGYLRESTTMSTFKPERALGSTTSLDESKDFDGNILNPQWKFEYDIIPNSQFNPIEWKNSKEYLNNPYFFDDDFCQLGFRPQDEITTEL